MFSFFYTDFVIIVAVFCCCRLNKLYNTLFTWFHSLSLSLSVVRSWLTLFRLWILYTCLLFIFFVILGSVFFQCIRMYAQPKILAEKKIWLRQLLFCWFFFFSISKWKNHFFYSTLCFARKIHLSYVKKCFFTVVTNNENDENFNFNTHFFEEKTKNHITKII